MAKYPSLKRTTVGSADFKAKCLEYIDHVKESRAEYIVTRHGKPVARLVPVEAKTPASIIGCMRGSVLKYDRPYDPVPGVWSIDHPEDEG
jgi:prevent-host-death family protein